MMEMIPCYGFGRDIYGHPIMYNLICDYKFDEILQNEEKTLISFIRFVSILFKKNIQWSEERNICQYRCIVIMDMSDIGCKQDNH